MTWNNYWQLLAGLGIFLFGMFQLEEALKQLAGRKFKLFLRKSTHNKYAAILSGTIVTGMLQSSSIVSLMVLSFVGAGVIGMQSALGVIFGANLGSTLTNWVIATVGFKLNIEEFCYPIIAISGIGIVFFNSYKNLHNGSKFFMGFGLLFLGLGFMKEAFDVLVMNFDFKEFRNLNILTLVFIGFSLTALIQASSATMVLTLSALSSGVITFEMAVAVVIGSELGTTVKILIGAFGGNAAKKQVAFGNIFFNIITVVVSLLLLHPIIALIYKITGYTEPLIGLVLFQSLINLMAILLFLPFIRPFGNLLEKMFLKHGKKATAFLHNASPLIPVAAIEVMQMETTLFLYRVIHLNRMAFKIPDNAKQLNNTFQSMILNDDTIHRSYLEKYEHVKRAEGEIISFFQKMSEQSMAKEDISRLNKFISTVRNAMFSAKCIKDIRQDKIDLRESAHDTKYSYYQLLQLQLQDFYYQIDAAIRTGETQSQFNLLAEAIMQIHKDYDDRMNTIYKDSENAVLEELDISTLLNLNREIYSSCQAMIYALKDFLLDQKSAENFDNLPSKLMH